MNNEIEITLRGIEARNYMLHKVAAENEKYEIMSQCDECAYRENGKCTKMGCCMRHVRCPHREENKMAIIQEKAKKVKAIMQDKTQQPLTFSEKVTFTFTFSTHNATP